MAKYDDIINDYTNGASGTVTTPAGQAVGYTVTSNVSNVNWFATQGAAKVGQGSGFFEVTFEKPVDKLALYVSSANSGEQYLVKIDGETVDLNDFIASGKAKFHALDTTSVVDKNGALTSTGRPTKDVAVLELKVPVTSIGVAGDGTGGGWDSFDVAFAGELPCFCAGTPIETPSGSRSVESLRPGDLVTTLDHGPQRVLWVGSRHCCAGELRRHPTRRPILFEPGALGPRMPSMPVRLSRQHRVLLGEGEGRGVLVPAVRLAELPGVHVEEDDRDVVYHHLLLKRHEILNSAGLPAESLYWGSRRDALFGGALATILSGLPAESRAAVQAMVPARPLLSRRRDVRPRLAGLFAMAHAP